MNRKRHVTRGRDQTPETTAAPKQHRGHHTPQAQHERQQRVLTQGKSAMVRGIADAVVMKNQQLLFLTDPDGRVPHHGDHGLGLYYHDCRFLKSYEMQLAGIAPQALGSTAQHGYMAVFELTNPDLQTGPGQLIPKEELGIHWERLLDAQQLALHEVMTFRNFGMQPYALPVTLTFDAGFEDIFGVREMAGQPPGRRAAPAWQEGTLIFVYHGTDQLQRSVMITFSPAPQATDETTAHFQLHVPPGESQAITVVLRIAECPILPAASGKRD